MIRDDLTKAVQAIDVANLIIESGVADDAVTRAYYAAFHVAKALVTMVEPHAGGKMSFGMEYWL